MFFCSELDLLRRTVTTDSSCYKCFQVLRLEPAWTSFTSTEIQTALTCMGKPDRGRREDDWPTTSGPLSIRFWFGSCRDEAQTDSIRDTSAMFVTCCRADQCYAVSCFMKAKHTFNELHSVYSDEPEHIDYLQLCHSKLNGM